MRIEDITAEIRPRTGEEAVDLGLALTRKHFGQIFRLWMSLVLPLCLVILGLCWWSPLLGVMILVWIKPIFGRIPLLVLSRELFGSSDSLKERRKQAWKAMWGGLFGDLVVHRLSMSRNLFLPIRMLEGLKGKVAKQRRMVIASQAGGSASAVTMQSEAFVMVVTLGLMFFVLSLLPEMQQMDWRAGLDYLMYASDFQLPLSLQWVLAIAYLIGMSLIEPFYIGAGFGLYINARTMTEGWDIELAFRRISSRLGSRSIKALIVGAGLLGCAFSASQSAVAAPLPEPAGDRIQVEPVDSEEASQSIERIMAQKEFEVRTEEIEIPDGLEFGDTPDWSLGFLGPIIQLIFWLALVALLVFLVWQVVRWLQGRSPGIGKEKFPAPRASSVMGMSLSPETLPDQIGREAWRLWEDGQKSASVALLYRAAISWWVHRAQLEIRESDTEGDCLRRVEGQASSPKLDQFKQVTEWRVLSAYGSRYPESAQMRAVCEAWKFEKNTPTEGVSNV